MQQGLKAVSEWVGADIIRLLFQNEIQVFRRFPQNFALYGILSHTLTNY